MLKPTIPADQLPADAAVFTQSGEFVYAGPRESCEPLAEDIGGLYCWVVNDRPVIRRNFERFDDGEIEVRRVEP